MVTRNVSVKKNIIKSTIYTNVCILIMCSLTKLNRIEMGGEKFKNLSPDQYIKYQREWN